MKDITTEEKIAFFQAMKKNNLPYREEPRSKEEIELTKSVSGIYLPNVPQKHR